MTLLQMSIQAAIMIIVISLVRKISIYHLPKKVFLILWGIVILRLTIPFSIPSPFSIYTQLARYTPIQEYIAPEQPLSLFIEQTAAADTINPVNHLISHPVNSAHSSEQIDLISNTTLPVSEFPEENLSVYNGHSGSKLPELLSYLPKIFWLSGVLGISCFFIIIWLRCHREFSASFPVTDDFVRTWRTLHPLRRTYSIRQTDLIRSPLTYGILHPVILLPKYADRTDTDKLHYILLHEYMHIRHLDALFKLILATALSIHWFNPFVWLMYLLANRDLELICDEAVLFAASGDRRSSYAMTLIHMEEQKAARFSFYSAFSENFIEERIKSIMKTKKTTIPSLLAAILLTTTVTGAFATSAADIPANFDPESSTTSSDTVIIQVSDSVFIEVPSISEDEFNEYLTQTEKDDFSQWYLKDEKEWKSFNTFTQDNSFAFINDSRDDYALLYEAMGVDFADLTLEELTNRIADFIYHHEEDSLHVAVRGNLNPLELPIDFSDDVKAAFDIDDMGIIIGQTHLAAINQLKAEAGLETTQTIVFIDNGSQAHLYTASPFYQKLQETYRVDRPFAYYVHEPSQLTVREFSNRLSEILYAMKTYWVKLGTSRLLFMDETDIINAFSEIAAQYSDELITFSVSPDFLIFSHELSGENELILEPDFESITVHYENEGSIQIEDIFRRADLFRKLKTLELIPAKDNKDYPAFSDTSSCIHFSLGDHTFVLGEDFLVADDIIYHIDSKAAEDIVEVFDRALSAKTK